MQIETFDGHRIELLSNQQELTRDPIAAIICCHGITADRHEFMGQLDSFAAACAREALLCYRFDFRGHGTSNLPSTAMSIAGEYVDLTTVYRAVSGETSVPIFLLGISFGALACGLLKTWSDHPIKGIVLWNPVLDPKATFLDSTTNFSRGAFSEALRPAVVRQLEWSVEGFKLGYSLLSEIDRYPFKKIWTVGTLSSAIVFHGDQDDIVPFKLTQSVLRAVPAVDLRVLHGERHGFQNSQREVIGETVRWITTHAR
jgi:alpha-beta hydrolase superfamily lysophospholipase